MGAKDMTTAFNEIAGDQASCQRSTHDYVHEHGAEMQILTFYGTWSDGTPFTLTTDKLRAKDDVLQASRAAAKTLLDQRNPP